MILAEIIFSVNDTSKYLVPPDKIQICKSFVTGTSKCTVPTRTVYEL